MFHLPSPHPRSTVISGIVQALAGVGKEFFAAVHQRLECAAGTARVSRHPSTALVCGIINAFRRYCQQFFAVGKKVYERSARRAGITCHPRASAVCGILNTFGTNAKHFASVSNHLWHNTFSFNLFIKFQKLFSLSNLQKNVFLLRIKSFFVEEFVYFFHLVHGIGRYLHTNSFMWAIIPSQISSLNFRNAASNVRFGKCRNISSLKNFFGEWKRQISFSMYIIFELANA